MAKSGYYFGVANATTATTPVSGYTIGAAASAYNSTGVRLFCSIEDGVVRSTPGAAGGSPVASTAGCVAYTTLRTGNRFWSNRPTRLLRIERRYTEMRKQKGFSLIELLIVVAIILIIAAIAIPNLLRARIAANEASAVASIRTINTAEVTYLTAYPTVGYSITLAALGPSAAGVARLLSSQCLSVGLHPGVGYDDGVGQERLLLRSGQLDHRNHAGFRLHRRRSSIGLQQYRCPPVLLD